MSPARPLRVLIVEDSADDAELLVAELRRAGFDPRWKRVETEADFVAALEEAEPPEIILSDYSMPQFDGLQAADLLRHRGVVIPFLLVSGTLGEEAAVEAMKRGCTDYVLKDRLARLGPAVERALDQTRLEADRAAMQSQLLLQSTALEHAANAMVMTDRRGTILWVNPAFLALNGYPAAEVLGRTPRLLKSGRHDEAFYREFWSTLVEGRTWRGEFVNRRKDGSLYTGEQTVTPVRDDSGAITHFIGILNDVTDRKRAEKALFESERLLRQVMDLVPHFIFAKDAAGRHLLVNRACAQASGLTPEQMVGLRDQDLTPDRDQADQFTRDDREVIATGRAKAIAQERFTNRDGQTRLLETVKVPFVLPGGTEPGVLGVAVDITERKHAEERLAAHHAVTSVLAEVDTLGEAARRILEILGRNLRWDVGTLWSVDQTTRRLHCVEIWHPPSTEFNEFVQFCRQATFAPGEGLPGRVYRSGQPVWIAEVSGETDLPWSPLLTRIGLNSAIAFPIRLGDHVHGVVEYFSARIRQPDGDLLSLFSTVGSQIGQFIDRKEVEAQLRQSQKMDAFGQLAGGVAHDFNNILAVIMGYSQLLMEGDDLGAESKDYLKQVYSAGERAANLTRQLLTFSRNKEMEVSELDLNEVIANMAKMLGRLIREDVSLQCHFENNLPSVQADQGMIEQVLMNLAVNARDAMPKGGPLIIATERVRVEPDSIPSNPEARAGDFVCLRVQDAGCGMPPEVQARIFEPFFTTKGVGKGTGLGLATVYGIVKQHQGWIEVDSRVGVGTTFRIHLPVSPRAEEARAEVAAESPVHGGHERILLVEDEVALRGLTRLVLQRQGYEVLEAGSGVEALEVWRQEGGRIDLLLTDMIMPDGLTGRELAKQLQALQPELKVIYASGYSADAAGTTFRLRDSATFIQKPYQPRKLLGMVRECLDR